MAGLVSVGAASPAFGAPQAASKPSGQAGQQIRSLREEVSEASAEEAAVLGQLDEAEGRRRQLDARVENLDRQLAAVGAEADAAEAGLDVVQAELVRAQMALTDAGQALAAARGELREQAVSAYVGNPSASAADSLLRSGNLRELAATGSYLASVAHARQRVVDRFRGVRDTTRGLQDSLEERTAAALAQRDAVVARRSALEAARAELDSTRRQVAREEAGHNALLSAVRARVGEFEGQIAALRGDSDSLGTLLQGVQAGRGPPPSTARRGMFRPPIPGASVTSPFGPRLHPVFGTVRMHNGVDFRGSASTPITAAAAGTVVYAGPRGGYGNTVVVDHGGALATLYAHQSAVFVSVGNGVAAGQVIGAVGSTGFSTGPHLHFEVRLGGTPVNPLGYL